MTQDGTIRTSLRWGLATLLLAALLPLAVAQVVQPIEPEDPDAPEVPGLPPVTDSIDLFDVGFAGPESVLHDEVADAYLVSNINGMPTELDGNGFISRVSPEGEVLELRWIDGEREGVDLDAPKGMAISGNILFVADITNVRMFDVQTGEPTGTVAIPGASFLNGVAEADSGGAYVTDTGVDADFRPTGNAAVYHVSADGMMVEVIATPELGTPNGVAGLGLETLVVVTLENPGRIIRIVGGEIDQTRELMAGSFDGVISLGGGELLVSSWSEAAVLRVNEEGLATPVIEGVESPADIGFDSTRRRVLIPMLQRDEVRLVTLPEERSEPQPQ